MNKMTTFFNIDNYSRFKDMSLIGWHRELDTRAKLFMLINCEETKQFVNETNKTVKAEHYIADTIDKIKKGFSFCDENNYRKSLFLINLKDIINLGLIEGYNYPPKRSVSPLQCDDIYGLVNDKNLEDVWRSCKLFCENKDLDHAETATMPVDLYENEADEYCKSARIVIDLDASDQQIIEDFQYILSKYRSLWKKDYYEKSFSESDLKKWFRFGVIPYLDLLLVARSEGGRITNYEIGNLIFPKEDGIDFTERVRKVTKPLAMSLITHHSLVAMNGQALQESE